VVATETVISNVIRILDFIGGNLEMTNPNLLGYASGGTSVFLGDSFAETCDCDGSVA